MENNIQVFNYGLHKVRTVEIDGAVWFVAKDVCDVLELSEVSNTLLRLDDDEKLIRKIFDSGQMRDMWIISESGLYALIFRSNKPEAKLFSRWVRSEVLPAIRKHGAYMTDNIIEKTLSDPDYLIKLANELKNERSKRQALEIKINEDKPKVKFAESVADSDSLMPIGNLAKILKQNGIETGRGRLFRWLRNNGYLQRGANSEKNMPTQKSMDLGLFQVVEQVFNTGYGSSKFACTSKITPKGQQYFINLFLNNPYFLDEAETYTNFN